MISQLADLILSAAGISGVEVQIRHPLGQKSQLPDRFCDPSAHPADHEDTDQDCDDDRIENELAGNPGAGPDALHGYAHDDVITAAGEDSPDLKKITPHARIGFFLDGIIIRLFQDLRVIIVKAHAVGVEPARHDHVIRFPVSDYRLVIQIQHDQSDIAGTFQFGKFSQKIIFINAVFPDMRVHQRIRPDQNTAQPDLIETFQKYIVGEEHRHHNQDKQADKHDRQLPGNRFLHKSRFLRKTESASPEQPSEQILLC